MSDHFAAFSFVDRITTLVPRQRIEGTFAIPVDIAAFPACLVAEAVGQLAAWGAMAAIGFRGRPVAALAQETRFLRAVRPGDRLDLAVDLESCDEEAVAYRGTAAVMGTPVIELADCLGPMLPVADFDDPQTLATRFTLLRAAGAPPGRFRGVPVFPLDECDRIAGESAQAVLAVPSEAAFFRDHFPRRPVFPATLLLDAKIRLALRVATVAEGVGAVGAATAPVAVRMTRVKVRTFTLPGQALTLTARVREKAGDTMTFDLSAEADGRAVATSRVDVAPGSPS